MGIERIVRLPSDATPDWAAVSARLDELGERPLLRMIDDLPAFPDEVPPADWRELRVGLSGGMVTLRRDGPLVRCIVWGTADTHLVRGRDACCWALAAAAGGAIEAAPGDLRSAETFRSEFLSPGG